MMAWLGIILLAVVAFIFIKKGGCGCSGKK